MKFNLISIIVIILIIYIYCYFIFPATVQILQTTINDFNFSLLYLRQPIVITDYLEEKDKLVNSWFNYNFIKKFDYRENSGDYQDESTWIHNNYKYLFINANENTEVIIYKASCYSCNPGENDRIIAIKLEAKQSLILPYKWKYYIKTKEEVDIWAIHDPITSFLGLVF